MLLCPALCLFVLNHAALFAKGFEAFRLGMQWRGAMGSDIGVLWVGGCRQSNHTLENNSHYIEIDLILDIYHQNLKGVQT